MTKEKMTIHKALIELKTIGSRIDKSINSNPFVTACKHSTTKIDGVSIEEYCKSIKAEYDSAMDLIDRRNAIKRAVVLSNAETKVMVMGREYTVAELIEMRDIGIEYLRKLKDTMSMRTRSAKNEAERMNNVLEDRANEYVKAMFEKTDLKNATDEMKRVKEEFIAAQTYELVDPLNTKKKLEELSTYIDKFIVDADAALSTSNAVTEIEIEY